MAKSDYLWHKMELYVFFFCVCNWYLYLEIRVACFDASLDPRFMETELRNKAVEFVILQEE